LMVGGFGINDTLNYDVDRDFKESRVVDISVSPNEVSDDLYYKINGLEGVERCEKVISYPVSISSDVTSVDTALNILEENSETFKINYNIDGGATIDKANANKLGVGIGDSVKVVINGAPYERVITNIFESSVLHGIYDLPSAYDKVTFTATGYYLRVKEGYSNDDIKNQILNLKDADDNIYEFKEILTAAEIMANANDLLSSIKLMTDVVKLFAILLCIVVIYNLTSLNISERTRDIATLKVLGFHYKEINKTLALEIIIDSFIGSLIGMFLGYPLMFIVMYVNQTDLFTFIYHMYWYTYLIGFAISFVTSIVVSLILNLKAKKINMTESLKSVE